MMMMITANVTGQADKESGTGWAPTVVESVKKALRTGRTLRKKSESYGDFKSQILHFKWKLVKVKTVKPQIPLSGARSWGQKENKHDRRPRQNHKAGTAPHPSGGLEPCGLNSPREAVAGFGVTEASAAAGAPSGFQVNFVLSFSLHLEMLLVSAERAHGEWALKASYDTLQLSVLLPGALLAWLAHGDNSHWDMFLGKGSPPATRTEMQKNQAAELCMVKRK